MDLLAVKVGQSDRLGEPKAEDVLHPFPSLQKVDVRVDEIAVSILREELTIFLDYKPSRKSIIKHIKITPANINSTDLMANRPMNQVKVDVVEPQVFQGDSNALFHLCKTVEGIPYLIRSKFQNIPIVCLDEHKAYFAGDENVLATDGPISKFLLQACSHFSLILVHMGTVQVSVTSINGISDSLLDFPRFGLGSNQVTIKSYNDL